MFLPLWKCHLLGTFYQGKPIHWKHIEKHVSNCSESVTLYGKYMRILWLVPKVTKFATNFYGKAVVPVCSIW